MWTLVLWTVLAFPGVPSLLSEDLGLSVPATVPVEPLRPSTPLSQDSLDLDGKATWPWGMADGLALDTSRNLAFLAVGRKLLVLEVSDPTAVDTLATLPLHDVARAVVYDPNRYLLYVANEYDGRVDLWKVANPQHPEFLSSQVVGVHLKAMKLRNDTLFCLTRWSPHLDLYRLDLSSSPPVLQPLTSVSLVGPVWPMGLELAGALAYVAAGPAGLQVVDLTTASVVGLYAPPGGDWFWDVEVQGLYAYTASDSGLRVLDLTNPAVPTLVAQLRFAGPGGKPARSVDLVLDDTTLYLITQQYWAPYGTMLRVVNISTPTAPFVVAADLRVHRWNTQMALDPGRHRLYLTLAHRGGLEIWEVSAPSAPAWLGEFTLEKAGFFGPMAFFGNYGYLSVGFPGIAVVDFTNPTDPQWIRLLPTPWGDPGIPAVDPVNQTLHVATLEGTYLVYDLASDPVNPPKLVDRAFPQFNFTDLQVVPDPLHARTLAYLTDVDSGFVVLSLSGSSLQRLSSLDLPAYGRAVRVFNSFAYVANDVNGLQVIDIADPANPVVVGHFSRPSYPYFALWDVDGDDHFVFLAYYDSLLVVDVTTPSAPVRVTGAPAANSRVLGVTLAGGKLLVANYGEGVRLWNPYPLTLVGYNSWPHYAHQVYPVQEGAYLVVAEGPAGFHVLKPTGGAVAIDERLESPARLPFRFLGNRIVAPEPGTLWLYDATGRLRFRAVFTPGTTSPLVPLPAGVYLWHWAPQAGKSLWGKVVLLR